MKQLFLIRHAKSSWGNAQLKDFDRPLNHRGRAAAPEMGDRLVKVGIFPDVIISSPAVRALTTAKLISKRLKKQVNIIEKPELYHASTFSLLTSVNQIADTLDTVFLVGHNPGLTDFAEYLSDKQFGNLPTAAIVGIRFEIDSWTLVSGSTGHCYFYDYPKNNS